MHTYIYTSLSLSIYIYIHMYIYVYVHAHGLHGFHGQGSRKRSVFSQTRVAIPCPLSVRTFASQHVAATSQHVADFSCGVQMQSQRAGLIRSQCAPSRRAATSRAAGAAAGARVRPHRRWPQLLYIREYSRTGVQAAVFYGNLREQTGENRFPRKPTESLFCSYCTEIFEKSPETSGSLRDNVVLESCTPVPS